MPYYSGRAIVTINSDIFYWLEVSQKKGEEKGKERKRNGTEIGQHVRHFFFFITSWISVKSMSPHMVPATRSDLWAQHQK